MEGRDLACVHRVCAHACAHLSVSSSAGGCTRWVPRTGAHSLYLLCAPCPPSCFLHGDHFLGPSLCSYCPSRAERPVEFLLRRRPYMPVLTARKKCPSPHGHSTLIKGSLHLQVPVVLEPASLTVRLHPHPREKVSPGFPEQSLHPTLPRMWGPTSLPWE